jgi:hypothetical protein
MTHRKSANYNLFILGEFTVYLKFGTSYWTSLWNYEGQLCNINTIVAFVVNDKYKKDF